MTPLEEFEAEISRRAQIGLVEVILNVAAEKHTRFSGWRECPCEFCSAKRFHTMKIGYIGQSPTRIAELTPWWKATPEKDYPSLCEWYEDRIKAARRMLIDDARREFAELKDEVL